MELAITNESTMVSNAEVELMCAAIQIQIALHYAPAWNQKPVPVKFYSKLSQVPGYAWWIHIIDNDAQIQGALGFHQEEISGKVDGYIMCEPILTNGGSALTFNSSNPGLYTVSGTLSHECLETCGNKYTNCWFDNGSVEICGEVADPVEQIGYGIMVNGTNVSVSDFVFPSFFNPYATKALNAPFNYLNTLTTQFSMLSGGYWIQRDDSGNERQVFGDAMPQWRRECKKKDFARSSRALKK